MQYKSEGCGTAMQAVFHSLTNILTRLSLPTLGTADTDPNNRGKKAARKTTQAGGSGADVAKIAAEQQAKLQQVREERMEALKQKQAEEPKPQPVVEEPEEEEVVEEVVEEMAPEPDGGSEQPALEPPSEEEGKKKKRVRTGPLVPDTVIGRSFSVQSTVQKQFLADMSKISQMYK